MGSIEASSDAHNLPGTHDDFQHGRSHHAHWHEIGRFGSRGRASCRRGQTWCWWLLKTSGFAIAFGNLALPSVKGSFREVLAAAEVAARQAATQPTP
jgi:hypothetical protein